MDSRVVILPLAQVDFEKLSHAISARVAAALLDLRDFPVHRTGIKKLKLPFQGYRKRVGNYRILFDFDNAVIVIQRIINRKDAYR